MVGVFTFAASVVAQETSQTAPERTTSTGIFSTEQSVRGEKVFQASCVSCHAASDYQGEKFQLDWVSRTVFDLFDSIRTLMPDDNPGILAASEYIDVVAYIFSLNNYPTGSDELPADDAVLKRIRIDAPPRGAVDPAARFRIVPHFLIRGR